MSKPSDWLLRVVVFASVWTLYSIVKHPDTPYFIRGLWRYAVVYVSRFLRWTALRLPRLTSEPDISSDFKKALAVVVILLIMAAVGSWPYNFYVFLRIFITAVLVLIMVSLNRQGNQFWLLTCALIAVLFNPVAPFHFSKESWKVLNWIAAALLAILTLASRTNSKIGLKHD